MSKKKNVGGGSDTSAETLADNEKLEETEAEDVEVTEDDSFEEEEETGVKTPKNLKEALSVINDLSKKFVALTEQVNQNIQMRGFEKAEKKGSKAIELSAMSDIEATRAALDKEEKISIVIPKGKFDAKGAVETVTINGYRLKIAKGTPVPVPMSVYKILAEYLNIEDSEEMNKMLISRDSEIEEKLS